MKRDVITGGCHCEELNFEIKGEPFWIGKCHCDDCQKISGSGYLPFIGCELNQIVISGEPVIYKSSKEVTRTFCGTCGSPFTFIDSEYPEKIYIHAGGVDESQELKFEEHIWIESKKDWDTICDDLPRR